MVDSRVVEDGNDKGVKMGVLLMSLEEIWGLKRALEENAPTISSCDLEFKNQ